MYTYLNFKKLFFFNFLEGVTDLDRTGITFLISFIEHLSFISPKINRYYSFKKNK